MSKAFHACSEHEGWGVSEWRGRGWGSSVLSEGSVRVVKVVDLITLRKRGNVSIFILSSCAAAAESIALLAHTSLSALHALYSIACSL